MRISSVGVWLVVAHFAVACATTGPLVKRDHLDAIHSVALVGFSGVVSWRENGQDPIDPPTPGSGAVETQLRRTSQATHAYDAMGERLTRRLEWKLTPREQLIATPEYQSMQSAHPTEPSALGAQRVPGIMTAEGVVLLTHLERQTLLRLLGVDAIALLRIETSVANRGGVSFGGMGKRTLYPRSTVELVIYDASSETPIWSDGAAVGEISPEGLEKTMGILHEREETPSVTAAIDSALDAVMRRFNAVQKPVRKGPAEAVKREDAATGEKALEQEH